MANPARVSTVLAHAPFTAYRGFAIALCVLVAVVDGLDFVAIGVVAPLMMQDMNLSAGQLGAILALTQIGAAIGALALGKAADRYGRKLLIIISLLLIAAFTWMTAVAKTFETLLVVRFLVGLALTGALPATLALTSELAPERYRATVVSLVVAGFPLGAAIGSLAGGVIAETIGWKAVFYFGAALPLILAVIIYYALPESPRFLALNDNRARYIGATMKRLVPNVDASTLWEPISKSLIPESERDQRRTPPEIRALFTAEFITPTMMLWTLLFCSGILSNVVLVWLPTIFNEAGYSVGYASRIVGAINIGAVLGMAAAGRILDSVGPRLTISMAFLVAAFATASLGLIEGTQLAILAAAVMGLFLGITTSAGYALSALIYPTAIRSSGVGGGAAALRIGTVAAPLIMPALLSFALPMKWTFASVAIVPFIAAAIASRFRNTRAS